jgi:hypothetical protein
METSGKQLTERREESDQAGMNMSMMWMMLICCGLPLLMVLAFPLFGSSRSSTLIWMVFGAIAIAFCVSAFLKKPKHR